VLEQHSGKPTKKQKTITRKRKTKDTKQKNPKKNNYRIGVTA
jgi:hypothetical protein